MYAGYVQCGHCAVFDSDPGWCALCGKPKTIGQAGISRAADRDKRRISVLSPNDSIPSVDRRVSARRRHLK
jgi:hypothetical protein